LKRRSGKQTFLRLPILLGMVLSVAGSLEAQSMRDDLDLLITACLQRSGFASRNAVNPGAVSLGFEANELKLALKLGIRAYQFALSSQDLPVCNFVPSCSNFAMTAIDWAGVVRGLLLASDRLQRCHNLAGALRFYTRDESSGRYWDPVDHYLFSRQPAGHSTGPCP
jgi:putative component of membrane protein insertase Oxa1/YidC/SpoIIIJ protein YidD